MAGEPYDTTRIFTLPNILSFIRLFVGIPLFLWLLLGKGNEVWAVVVLAVGGATDWLDGQLARRWKQRSRLGQVLDPLADRLYTLATLVGFVLRGDIIPWWFAVLLVGRDVLLGITLWPALRRRGYFSLPVHFLGKAATFVLLYAFPLLLLGSGDEAWQFGFRIIGWALVIWGAVLYWGAGLLYLRQGISAIRRIPPLSRTAVTDSSETVA
ncbi:MAG: CDP-alcohol phosphatidyltransferase family protein [Propionicimonas sp.]|uniref:CDP-alcohol phosphatidyltransferase family protein n=1 Tax=Propionicimonas sp. TaxID=1955623 RepID=UPI002B220ECE|nr:CDP-alcohol phosphatidyltransferase family protein [Propionicimonas sp.]MEA4945645.1 CDP-alcohol phosphatidyltransferase family protein [Propionicimonas sp.]MEA5054462.1 CDP-alcohol phosphatidyltransferase family protein [Propionicimonas sp.]MEA5118871.1 CDP-alcohol phosphatidyltransferase family protein [Propionicimonas sp.]